MNKQKGENLPQGWAKATLGEVCSKIVDGSHNPPAKKNDGIPMLSARNIENGRIEFSNFRYISLEEFEIENARTRIAPDDVLLTIVGTIGRVAVVPKNTPSFALQRSVAALKPIEILSKFCMYQFQSHNFQNILAGAAKGTAQKGVYLKKLSQLPFLIPPLPEQQRIVEELETHFSRLDEVVKSLKRLKTNLQRLRASILKWAFEGKLVPIEAELARQEKHQYEPARELLKRILEERRVKWEADQLIKMEEQGKLPKNDKWKEKYPEPKVIDKENLNELPEGWTWVCSDAFFYFITSGSRGWADYYSNSGALFLRIGNLNHNSIDLDFSKLQRVNPPEGTEGIRTKIKPNDILVSITADVGMVALAPENIELAYINQHVALARPVESINRIYLAWYLASEQGQAQFSEMQRGVTKVGLGLDDIKSVNVPLPPFNEQTRIIEEIERRFSVINKIESVVKTNLRRAESLRQKLLQDAFAGKLVKQNSNDEPASILLERIKTERERLKTESQEERTKKPQIMKHNKMERREITEVLKESKTEMTPEQLFNAAGFNPDEVEEFYAELKRADDAKVINQEKKDNGSVYLTAKV